MQFLLLLLGIDESFQRRRRRTGRILHGFEDAAIGRHRLGGRGREEGGGEEEAIEKRPMLEGLEMKGLVEGHLMRLVDTR